MGLRDGNSPARLELVNLIISSIGNYFEVTLEAFTFLFGGEIKVKSCSFETLDRGQRLVFAPAFMCRVSQSMKVP